MAAPKTPTPSMDAKQKANSIEELRYLQQIYQNQYLQLGNEAQSTMELMREIERARTTLDEMDRIEGKNQLIPIGYGVFADGKVTNGKKFVLGVGAGAFVEKDIDAAKAHITKVYERETKHIEHLGKAKRDIEAALMEISYRLEQLSH